MILGIVMKKNRRLRFICIVFLLGNIQLFAVNPQDRLEQQFDNHMVPKAKYEIAEQLVKVYKDSIRTKALFYGNHAIKFAEEAGMISEVASMHLRVGRLLEKNADYSKAVYHYQLAHKLFSELEDAKNLAFSLYRLGNVNKKLGFYQKALKSCLQGLDIYEGLNDSTGLAHTYNCLGSIYKYQKEYSRSIDYYTRILKIHQARNNMGGVSMAYNNMGIIYKLQKNLALAKSYYERSLEINKEVGSAKQQGIYLNNLGIVYLEENNFEKAFEYFSKSLSIRHSLNDRRGIATAYINFGDYYFQNDSLDLSLEFYLKALEINKEIGVKESVKDIYLSIHEIYKLRTEFEKAYVYYLKYNEINKELFNLEKSRQIAFLGFEYEQNKQDEAQKLKEQRYKFLIVGIVAIMFLGLIIIVLLFQRQSTRVQKAKLEKENSELQKRQIESQLELKNKELTMLALQKTQKSEIVNSVTQRLREVQYNLKKENRPIVQSVIEELEENNPDAWKEFEIRFFEVHKDFYTKLGKEFPNLTQNELRLSAFLRLNMSTKEISAITNQTPHSINIARGRLRKKINISCTDVNLYDFLQQF